MFRCQWVGSEKGTKTIRTEDGLTLVNFRNATKYPKDPFILAEHASHVFYSNEGKYNWRVVMKAPPRGKCLDEDTINDSMSQLEVSMLHL